MECVRKIQPFRKSPHSQAPEHRGLDEAEAPTQNGLACDLEGGNELKRGEEEGERQAQGGDEDDRPGTRDAARSEFPYSRRKIS